MASIDKRVKILFTAKCNSSVFCYWYSPLYDFKIRDPWERGSLSYGPLRPEYMDQEAIAPFGDVQMFHAFPIKQPLSTRLFRLMTISMTYFST